MSARKEPGSDAPGICEIETYRPNEVVIKTHVLHHAYLVLNDIHFPGWRCFVDGEETPILRANFLFRAVALAPGEHRVRFVYRPSRLWAGISVTAATLLLSLVCLVLGSLRGPSRPGA